MKYFGKIKRLIEYITSLDVDQMLFEITSRQETKELIIRLNTKGQLADGINSEGEDLKSIGGEYSIPYAQFKASLGLRVDEVTLLLTGDLYDSFDVDPFLGGFEISADTDKGDGQDLTVRWGKEIIGLTDENKKILRAYYRDEVLKMVRKGIKNL